MFDSLEETMKHDEQEQSTPRERWLRYALTAILAVIVFSGLMLGIRLLE